MKRTYGTTVCLILTLLLCTLAVSAQTSHQWNDTANLTIIFKITGSSTASSAVHKVILNVGTGGNSPTGSRVIGPNGEDSGSQGVPWVTPWDYISPSPGKHVTLTGTGPYVLTMEQKPTGFGGGTISSDEVWSVTLSSIPVPNTIDVTISAEDRSGGDATSLVALIVPPDPQIAPPTGLRVSAGDTVNFSVTPTDPTYTYSWTCAGATTTTGLDTATPDATYEGVSGTYTASVVVTDSFGQEGYDSVEIDLTNGPPTLEGIVVTPDSTSPFAGASRTFAANSPGTGDNMPLSSLAYSWTFTGADIVNSSAPSPLVGFSTPGTGSVSLTVTDNVGQTVTDTIPQISVLPREDIVIPAFAALPANYSPPAIDGIISEDLGSIVPDVSWTGATQIDYADGTTRDVAIAALNSPDGSGHRSLYVAFQVRNDPTFDAEDYVLLAFRGPGTGTMPDTSAAFQEGDVVVVVYPMPAGTISPGNNLTPGLVQFYRYQGGSWIPAGSGSAALTGFGAKSRVLPATTPQAWDLELRIPMSDRDAADSVSWPDLKDNFLFYCNVGRVDGSQAQVTQYLWPRDAPYLTGTLGPDLLAASDWSSATTDPAAVGRGVYIASALDFGVDSAGVFTNQIVHPGTNSFKARVSNSTIKETPSGPSSTTLSGEVAPQVTATFRIAAWGTNFSNPQWSVIPADPASANPPAPHDIPAPTDPAGDQSYSSPGTTVFSFEASNLSVPNGVTHQCMFIELSSAGNVRIVNSKYYRNMTYVDGSRFEDEARLTLGTALLPRPGRDFERLFLRVTTQRYEGDLRPGRANQRAKPMLTPVSSLVWLAHSFRDTTNHLTVRESPYLVVQRAGSFGYIVRHEGDTLRWTFDLQGATRLDNNFFRYDIPLEHLATGVPEIVNPVIEPVDRKWEIGLSAGTTVPLDPGTSSYNPGFAAQLEARYFLSPALRVGFLAGFSGLQGKSGAPDMTIVNGSIEAAYGFTMRGLWLLAAHGGLGWYHVLDGNGNIGTHAGIEMERRIKRAIALGLRFDYHRMFDTAGTQYLTAVVGLMLRF